MTFGKRMESWYLMQEDVLTDEELGYLDSRPSDRKLLLLLDLIHEGETYASSTGQTCLALRFGNPSRQMTAIRFLYDQLSCVCPPAWIDARKIDGLARRMDGKEDENAT